MPEIEHNAPLFQYRVYWNQDIPGAQTNTETIGNWRQSELVVRDQPTFQRYKIRVVAVNRMGEANVIANPVIGYSGEDRKWF